MQKNRKFKRIAALIGAAMLIILTFLVVIPASAETFVENKAYDSAWGITGNVSELGLSWFRQRYKDIAGATKLPDMVCAFSTENICLKSWDYLFETDTRYNYGNYYLGTCLIGLYDTSANHNRTSYLADVSFDVKGSDDTLGAKYIEMTFRSVTGNNLSWFRFDWNADLQHWSFIDARINSTVVDVGNYHLEVYMAYDLSTVPNYPIAVYSVENILTDIYGLEGEGNCITYPEEYALGFDVGYNTHYFDEYNEAFEAGRNDALNNTATFKDMIFAIFGAPVELINGMLDFDLLGINVASFVKTIVTLSVVAAIAFVIIKFIK